MTLRTSFNFPDLCGQIAKPICTIGIDISSTLNGILIYRIGRTIDLDLDSVDNYKVELRRQLFTTPGIFEILAKDVIHCYQLSIRKASL